MAANREFDAALAEILGEFLARTGAGGVLCAVSDAGALSTHSAGNISPGQHGAPFYIYSLTKSFTAAAILLLAERDGGFLDEPFVRLLPGAPVPPAATVRQMLNHTAGISDYFGSAAYRDAVCRHPEAPWPRAELLRAGLEGTPLFAPGTGWAYSNPAYALLNDLIESRSGLGFHDFVEEHILRPLALTETRAFVAPDRELRLLPAAEPSIEGDFRARYAPGWILPGCLISTVADVARFYEALLTGGLLRAESLRQMTTTVLVPHAGEGASYGLGLMHHRGDPLGDGYGHGGGGPGYTTYARCHPAFRGGAPLTVSLVVNQSLPATPFALADRIAEAFARFES